MKEVIKVAIMCIACMHYTILFSQSADTLGMERNTQGKIMYARIKSGIGKMADGHNFLKRTISKNKFI